MNIFSIFNSKRAYYFKKFFILIFAIILASSFVFSVIGFPFQVSACWEPPCEPPPWEPPTCFYTISGMKFNDENGDSINNEEPGLEGWTITIKSCCFSNSTITNDQGNYSFASLFPGHYTVCEVSKEGWEQTYPTENNGCHFIKIKNEDVSEVDFGNWKLSYCGDGNLDSGEECDEGENNGLECTPEYGSSCLYCSLECEIVELTGSYCGDGNLDSSEECDDGNLEDGDGCSSICQIEEGEPEEGIKAGDIVINEIMQDPEAVPDSEGEWFEFYNSTDSDIDLEGCLIRDAGEDSHTINTSLVVPAGGFVVLARNGNSEENGGITPDYVYSGLILANDGDEIILECNGTEIDRVEYDGGPNFPDPTGASMILSHPALDNNVGSNWCVSTSSFGAGDLGTPGAQNDSCGICTDNDEDGYAIEGGECGPIDCDDTNAGVNPAALEICDNDLDDDCDGYIDSNDPNCQVGAPGGVIGGAGPAPLTIFNETNAEVFADKATVTWFTNNLTTSRVIYDTISHPILADPPNYGYAYSTTEDSTKVTFHTVTITGLTPNTTYYWRAVSHSSPEILGNEMTFTTAAVQEEEIGEGVEEEVEEGAVEEIEEISLEEIEEELDEIGEQIERLREEIEGIFPPAPPVPPLVSEVEAAEEEISEEIEIEEEELEEEFKEEEKPEAGLERFLAAIGALPFNLKLILIILGIIIIGLIILRLIRKRKIKI